MVWLVQWDEPRSLAVQAVRRLALRLHRSLVNRLVVGEGAVDFSLASRRRRIRPADFSKLACFSKLPFWITTVGGSGLVLPKL